MKRFFVPLLCLFSICAHADTHPFIVHEWGTFTSLQDETGRAIGGINSDDEPVPKFVHDLNRLLILKPDHLPPVCYQGAPRCHPDVTMRLETPVIKSAGLRLFFLVPRDWTEHYLPLEVSVPAKVSRVMVGRIELVTPEHRHLLRQIAEAPIPTKPWAGFANENGKSVIRGAMPPAYHDLGRFRNALVLDELNRRPTESLRFFIQLNGLHASSLAL